MAATQSEQKKPLFQDLGAQIDMDDLETSEMESMCMRCHKNGTTKILLTVVPMFRELIVSSFSCPHCGESNTEVQRGGAIQDKGVCFTLTVGDAECLNRMIVKSDTAIVRLPALEFEIPARRGQITTVESILKQAISNLELDQPYRLSTQPEVGKQIEAVIGRLEDCLKVKQPFTVVLDDPAGNSFLQGLLGETDPHLAVEHYTRSPEQDQVLMLGGEGSGVTDAGQQDNGTTGDGGDGESIGSEEVLALHTNCSGCHSPVETRMKLVDIPLFKQVVIMATSCEYCGLRTNEVKSGSGISDQGTKITLKLTAPSDLTRDILKAETAMLLIPELDFEAVSGTLGGCFTTVEGLLVQARDQLATSHMLYTGDSATSEDRTKFTEFVEKLNKIISGEMLDVHVILDDPAGNSYVQNVYAPDADPHMTIENYKRSFEQDEALGLNDMKTENYTSDEKT